MRRFPDNRSRIGMRWSTRRPGVTMGAMRRILGALAAVALAASACGGNQGAKTSVLTTYYEGTGLFNVGVPHGNLTQPMQTQTVASIVPASFDSTQILGGVITAPAPQQQSQQLLGANLGAQAAPQGPTYGILAVDGSGFATLDDMVVFFATGDPNTDVKTDQPMPVGDAQGRLVVSDNRSAGTTSAAALRLDGNTGYLILGIFPLGGWDAHQEEFIRIATSFRAGAPPLAETFPFRAPVP